MHHGLDNTTMAWTVAPFNFLAEWKIRKNNMMKKWMIYTQHILKINLVNFLEKKVKHHLIFANTFSSRKKAGETLPVRVCIKRVSLQTRRRNIERRRWMKAVREFFGGVFPWAARRVRAKPRDQCWLLSVCVHCIDDTEIDSVLSCIFSLFLTPLRSSSFPPVTHPPGRYLLFYLFVLTQKQKSFGLD